MLYNGTNKLKEEVEKLVKDEETYAVLRALG